MGAGRRCRSAGHRPRARHRRRHRSAAAARGRRVTIDELHREARKDLETGGLDALLKWTVLHARAVAARIVGEKALKHAQTLDYDKHLRIVSALPSQSALMTAVIELPPTPGDMAAVEQKLEQAAALEAACAHVLRFIEKKLGRVPAPITTARITPTKPKAA